MLQVASRLVRRNGQAFHVLSGTNDQFWNSFEKHWERGTLEVFNQNFEPGGTFLDIGSWIGATALYAASKGQRTICIEADPKALRELKTNIALNPELEPLITVIEKAIYPTKGVVQFGSRGQGGDSTSSFTHAHMTTTWSVETVTPKDLRGIVGKPRHLFIKMDIEGGEYFVFPALIDAFRPLNPTIVLSLHAKFLPCGYVQRRQLSRHIFRACQGFRAERVRNAPRAFGGLRSLFARSGLSLCHPQGTWLLSQKT